MKKRVRIRERKPPKDPLKVLESLTLNEEIWKDVVGYEGLYMVSSFGRIFSMGIPHRLPRNKEIFARRQMTIMIGSLSRNGYRRASFSGCAKKRTRNIHRLVAEAFIPNTENKPTVNHKDGNKQNNHVDNLEWANYSEQQRHAIKTGLIKRHSRGYERQPCFAVKDCAIWEFDSMVDAKNKIGIGRGTLLSYANSEREYNGYRIYK